MRGLEQHHMNLQPHHTFHMPCHHFLVIPLSLMNSDFPILSQFLEFQQEFQQVAILLQDGVKL